MQQIQIKRSKITKLQQYKHKYKNRIKAAILHSSSYSFLFIVVKQTYLIYYIFYRALWSLCFIACQFYTSYQHRNIFYFVLSYNILNTMENYNTYDHKLNAILTQFHGTTSAAKESNEGYGLALFDCKPSFKGRYLKSLIMLKKKIVDMLQDKLPIFQEQKKKILQRVLKNFTVQHEVFLLEGIFNTYLSLADLVKREQTECQQQPNSSRQYLEFLKSSIKQMRTMLLYYFTNRQYKRRNNLISPQLTKQKHKIGSQKKVQRSIRQSGLGADQEVENETLLQQIEFELQPLTITQLLEKYLREEEDHVVDSIQICRVCEQKIKLKNFEKHIKNCSRKAKLQAQLKEKQMQKHIYCEQLMQTQKTLILKKGAMTQEQTEFLRLISVVKRIFQKPQNKNRLRRNTQFSTFKGQLIEQIKDQLYVFEKTYEEKPLLRKLIQNKQDLINIRKRLQVVQMNFQIQVKSNKDSEIGSFKSLQSSIHNVMTTTIKLKTKKSIFASKAERGDSKDSKQRSKQQKLNNSFSSCSSISIQASQRSEQQVQSSQSVNEVIKKREKKPVKTQFYFESKQKINLNPSTEIKQKKNGFSSMKDICHFDDIEESQKVQLNDFEILKFLGKGAFGQVYLVRRKSTQDLYALKHIKLINAQTPAQLELIKKQHQIFKKIAGDHLIRAPFAFTQKFGHFFVLEFMPGGDLSKILAQQVYLTQDQAKFYLAQIVLAVQHLHKCEIIHRDLKPQNIVIDKNGHIKLTDFGLSDIKIQDKLIKAKQKPNTSQRRLKQRNNLPIGNTNRRVALVNRADIAKIIGTPDYIAPQIINQTSINNQSIDWWSLGVIAYEMLVGCRPFSAMTIDEVLKNIIQCKIQWPQIGREDQMMSPEAYDLISKFLDRNFQRRIGSSNCQQIKRHPFFEGVDWDNIKNQKPPLIPTKQLNQIQQYLNSTENLNLRTQITKIEKSEQKKIHKNINLQNFVRYDVLLEQTCESVDRIIKKQKQKMLRIMTIGQFMELQQKQNERGSLITSTDFKNLKADKEFRTKNKERKVKNVSFLASEVKID